MLRRNVLPPAKDSMRVWTAGGGEDGVGGEAVGADADGVEEALGDDLVAEPLDAGGEGAGQRVNASGDALEAFGAVPDGVHARHHREQDLGGADVARRLLAADVLLARLQ